MIGWYVHHQGRGHLHRAQAIAAVLREEVTVLSSLPEEQWAEWVRLERDDEGGTRDADAHGRLHYAPVDNDGHRARMARIAAWVKAARPRLVVVDVSVEVTVLLRTMGVPVVVMAMPGERADAPHGLGYDLADAVIAPWPGGLHRPAHLERLGDRVHHVGGISRYAARPPGEAAPVPAPARRSGHSRPARSPADARDGARRVLLLGGAGGSALTATDLDRARVTSPGWEWRVAGPLGDWHDDVWPLLRDADVAVIAAGQNSVADVAAAGTRAVVIPEDRPFGEQRATAAVLADAGLAVVRDSWPGEWGPVLDEAMRSTPDWSRWGVQGAAQRAAAVIEGLA